MKSRYRWEYQDDDRNHHRVDGAVAGRDPDHHLLYYCQAPDGRRKTGFRVLSSAMNYADDHWPVKVKIEKRDWR